MCEISPHVTEKWTIYVLTNKVLFSFKVKVRIAYNFPKGSNYMRKLVVMNQRVFQIKNQHVFQIKIICFHYFKISMKDSLHNYKKMSQLRISEKEVVSRAVKKLKMAEKSKNSYLFLQYILPTFLM